jgi:hypothetical protein
MVGRLSENRKVTCAKPGDFATLIYK